MVLPTEAPNIVGGGKRKDSTSYILAALISPRSPVFLILSLPTVGGPQGSVLSLHLPSSLLVISFTPPQPQLLLQPSFQPCLWSPDLPSEPGICILNEASPPRWSELIPFPREAAPIRSQGRPPQKASLTLPSPRSVSHILLVLFPSSSQPLYSAELLTPCL